jgi:metal transporter CNNM
MGDNCEFFTPWCDPASFWMFLVVSLVLICAAGLMAGLTMGLLSLDMLNMRILELEGSAEEKRQAKKVLPVLSQHHMLLVTLLLVNAGANEALPIFLNKLVPEAVSILLSVTCVLLFGEIIPSAVFTGPSQLRIAAWLCPAVRVLMLVASPLAYPISKVLDWWLGADHDPAQYKRKELKALVALQRETDAARKHFIDHLRQSHAADGTTITPSGIASLVRSSSSQSGFSTAPPARTPHTLYQDGEYGTKLHVDEVTIIHGALDLAAKTVTAVMIPMKQVYMLEIDTELNHNVMADILASGHSRIPVFEDHKSNIVGLLLVKRLIVLDPDDARPLRDLVYRKPILVGPNESCYAILNEFQKGRSHIALVTNQVPTVSHCWQQGLPIPEGVQFDGIVTIEDVIEELIQEEIEDESDVYVHDIVDYWKARSRVKGQKPWVNTAGKTAIGKKLRVLADRARKRVKNRHTTQAGGGEQAPLAPSIEVKVVTEKTPLMASAGH